MRKYLLPLMLLLLADAAREALAAVDLVTIPRREGVQLTIYNSEDLTMVREHRLLTVKPGVNRIQFSWANTLIDPTSIDFRILENQEKVDLVDTTFPSGRNDALQWNVESQLAGKLAVEIRYFTSGITWSADYVGIANENETKLHLTGYVRVTNSSGEVYDNAETRLVVGNVNLVEKIADLARRPRRRAIASSGRRLGRGRARRPAAGRGIMDAEGLDINGVATFGGVGGGGGRAARQAAAGRQAGPLRVLPLRHRGPRRHQRQGAQAAGLDEGGRSAAGMFL